MNKRQRGRLKRRAKQWTRKHGPHTPRGDFAGPRHRGINDFLKHYSRKPHFK